MENNSKILTILFTLFVFVFLISTAGALDYDLASNGFDSENFLIDTPEGSNFIKKTTTDFNSGNLSMSMEIFTNHGNNTDDLSTIMYLKDSSDKNIFSDFINDLKNDGYLVEENDNYFLLKNQNSNDWNFFNFDIANNFNSLWTIAEGILSPDTDINLRADGDNVEVSNGGIKIADSDNNNVSLSTKGLEVSDSDGENVSISADGIKVSKASGKASADGNISIDSDMLFNVQDADYIICIKSKNSNQVIIITGNNLELMKSMADTASFSEN